MIKICQQCKGTGRHEATIRNLGTLEYETHIVPCLHVGCDNGMVDTDAYYIAMGITLDKPAVGIKMD